VRSSSAQGPYTDWVIEDDHNACNVYARP
jgi:hypothetical protein